MHSVIQFEKKHVVKKFIFEDGKAGLNYLLVMCFLIKGAKIIIQDSLFK